MYADNQAGYGMTNAPTPPWGRGASQLGEVKYAEPPRRPELAEQADRLEKAVAYMEESISELSSRLGGVVRPPMPEPAGNSQIATSGPSTHYGQIVSEFAARANRAAERIQDLMRRLEV